MRSAVTANPESAGGSGVAGATGAAVDANGMDQPDNGLHVCACEACLLQP